MKWDFSRGNYMFRFSQLSVCVRGDKQVSCFSCCSRKWHLFQLLPDALYIVYFFCFVLFTKNIIITISLAGSNILHPQIIKYFTCSLYSFFQLYFQMVIKLTTNLMISCMKIFLCHRLDFPFWSMIWSGFLLDCTPAD